MTSPLRVSANYATKPKSNLNNCQSSSVPVKESDLEKGMVIGDKNWQNLKAGNVEGKVWGFTGAEWKKICKSVEAARSKVLLRFNPAVRAKLEKVPFTLYFSNGKIAHAFKGLSGNCFSDPGSATGQTCKYNDISYNVSLNLNGKLRITDVTGSTERYLWEKEADWFLNYSLTHEYLHIVFSMYNSHADINGNSKLFDFDKFKSDIDTFSAERKKNPAMSGYGVDIENDKQFYASQGFPADQAYEEHFADIGAIICSTNPQFEFFIPDYLIQHYEPIFAQGAIKNNR